MPCDFHSATASEVTVHFGQHFGQIQPFGWFFEWSDGESNPDLLNAIQPSSR